MVLTFSQQKGKKKFYESQHESWCRLSPVAVEVVWLCSHPEQVFSCTTVSLFNWKKGFRSSLRFHSTLSHIVKYFTDCTFYVKLLLLLFFFNCFFVCLGFFTFFVFFLILQFSRPFLWGPSQPVPPHIKLSALWNRKTHCLGQLTVHVLHP